MKSKTKNKFMIIRTRGISKGVVIVIDVHSQRNNNKEGFQNRIGGFHHDKLEMISQRRGSNS